MGCIRVAVTKITLLCSVKKRKITLLCKGLFGKRSSHGNTSQQLDAPHSSASTSRIESINSNAPALPPPLPSGEYEVFLNFRGPDTRHRITDILYRFLVHLKIRTFRDDDELRVGEGIWPELVRAISQSKIYVVIFSESYAHSKWCLKELAEIVEHRKRDRGHVVIPVFYMVDPGDVRHQTGPYEDAFRQHQVEFDENTIRNWKNALKEVGNLKGYHITSKNGDGATADLVANVVWSHLSKNNFALETDELVGIEDHVEEVVHKLSLDSGNVSTVGIHGIGGIGKTTLAMAVYNKISARFDRCSFLDNIREIQQEIDGTFVLQKKLISNILRLNSAGSMVVDSREGRRIITERVSQFKVLVVLDDVDENFKFDEVLGNLGNFISGSRFIITSRNVKVLQSIDRDRRCELYEVPEMSSDRSLQLFCKHASGMDSPPPGLETLSKDIVSTTGGLPLALKVVGSSLFREEVVVWKDKLAQLKTMPEKEVVKRLRISYDPLGHEAKHIFLDIACFFIGKDKEIASYMWSDCNYFPVSNINILIQRSMIKIGERNEFQMHDQLRDMGREIVREENVDYPWKRSRIWKQEEAKELLLNKKGTDKVKAMRVNVNSLDLQNEHFTNLSELRYFNGQGTRLRGDFSGLLPNLRWLQLQDQKESSNPADFHMDNLIVFDFSDAKVGDDWRGWSHIKRAKKLKVLDLSNLFTNLTKLPEFPESGSLEMLNLQNFNSMRSSPNDAELDIRNLSNLKVLNLYRSRWRKIKGGTFGMMKWLRELDLTNIQCTENLKESLADIGELPLLETLRAVNANAVVEGQGEVLSGIKLPASLKQLDASSAVANLAELLELRQLGLSDCESTVVIPATSTSWWKSSKLESLTLYFFPNLVMVPNNTLLPSRLTKLYINYMTSEWLPDLENLGSLTQLELVACTKLKEIRGLGTLKLLQCLMIADAPCLTRLDGLGKLMSSSSSSNCKLAKLMISDAPLLTRALDDCGGRELAVVDSLREMNIAACPKLDGGSIPCLSKLPRLKVLTIVGILRFDGDHSGSALLEGLGDLGELVELELVQLPTVRSLPSLSKLRELRRLTLRHIPNLREIEGLEGLKSLEVLYLDQCMSLERFPAASLPSSMKRMMLDLRGCENFTSDLSSLLTVERQDVTILWPQEPHPDHQQ